MHLLPVLDENGIPAFYDTVSRKLFCNSGEDELIAGPIIGVMRYTPLEYIECSGSAICALQSYIMLPVEINLRADSFAFETEHELVQSNENQAEGMNIFNPMMFYGMRTNGVAYYGFGYGNNGTVADGGASVMPGYSVFRAEYDKGNSNWFVFMTLLLYLMVAVVFFTTPSQKPWLGIGAMVLLDGATVYIFSMLKPPYWYNTLLCFPAGMIWLLLCKMSNDNVLRWRGAVLAGMSASWLVAAHAWWRHSKRCSSAYGLVRQYAG